MLASKVAYSKSVRFTSGGPVVLHVIKAPPPGGLYFLRPVLGAATVLGRERVTSVQRRLARRVTTAGVNGDFSNYAGRPSGIFLRDGVLQSRPLSRRSSLGIAFDGTLLVDRLRYRGFWQAAGFERRPARELNRPLEEAGVAIYTDVYGGATPRARDRVDAVVRRVRPLLPGGLRTGRVVAKRWGGGSLVPQGGAVLQGRGSWRGILGREAKVGERVTLEPVVEGLWPDVADAVGGGPVLVRNGKVVWSPDEDFTDSQLHSRHPRTAVGQRADGRLLLVVADGRSTSSAGLRTWELALEMLRLGAVTAMGLDGGGSSTMAFDGRVLNSPSDGAERPVGNSLLVFYYGAYAPRPARPVVSPNGDGVLDTERLSARITRRSTVRVRLLHPDGTVAWRWSGVAARRVIRHELLRTRREGTWKWIVKASDKAGRKSRMVRRFRVNNTLGYLVLSTSRIRLAPGRRRTVRIRVDLTRHSKVVVHVRRRADGRVVRRLSARQRAPGTLGFRWDGRNAKGRLVREGSYRIVVRAANALGAISLDRHLRVTRVRAP